MPTNREDHSLINFSLFCRNVCNIESNLPDDADDFKTTRTRGLVYVDKTKFLFDLRNNDIQLFFFIRARRFGKTFLVTTLESYFSGEEHLFHGT